MSETITESEDCQPLPTDDRTLKEKLAEGETLSHYEKVEYIFEVIVKLEKLVDSLGPQLEALTSGPMAGMLSMFGIGK